MQKISRINLILKMKKHILFILLLVSCLPAYINASTPKVVAHRGYWTPAGSAQNSLRSLAKADSIACFASEFDVWMTADSTLVVNHNPTTPSGIVIETSNASEVIADKLNNGETVPTLKEYLEYAKQFPKLRLVLELKEHNNKLLERSAVDKILKMVHSLGLDERTDYITFSRDAFNDFVRKAPKCSEVYYLTGDYIPQQIFYIKATGIDYNLGTLKKNPQWIDECHKLGLKVNVWTVNKPEDMQWCIDRGVDFITTNDPELLQKLLKK